MTDWLRPADLAQALAMRAENPEHVLFAGGTDLMVAFRDEGGPEGVIDLFGLPELEAIVAEGDGLAIGAGATYATILDSDLVRRRAPLLAWAVREIGSAQIRARGTIGGNVATCSPVGDTLPALLALDAEIEAASPDGRRRIPAEEFIAGYRRTALRSDELVVAIHLPPSSGRHVWWRKVGSRRAVSIAKVSLAATAALAPSGAITSPRLAMGAVAERVVRLPGTERALEGARPDESLARNAARVARSEITPIDDLRSTAAYRSAVAGNLVAAFVRALARGT